MARVIVQAPGYHVPNWVDFAGPKGLQLAYSLERAYLAAILRHPIQGPNSIYTQVEAASHDEILRELRRVAKEWNVRLVNTPAGEVQDISRYHKFAASPTGRWRKLPIGPKYFATSILGTVFKDDTPRITDPINYSPE